MEGKKENIYFYTMINDKKGIKSSDICYGIDYDKNTNSFKTILEDEELIFAIEGDIKHTQGSISFNTMDEKVVKLRYINLPLYDSLKGYLINYNSPNLSSDKEVQDYFKSKKNFLKK
ncbi:hypothetical protein [uncultured Clostridium sp.]|jgi:uncharacterized protein (UPF0264 family)|uniref:hypothetical protein n=1 Tax=uncultured Clostridium sp. TaxID=59620 RepID=UPI002602E688|nr:hypothetical protein [uncultured Clostridium sp.]